MATSSLTGCRARLGGCRLAFAASAPLRPSQADCVLRGSWSVSPAVKPRAAPRRPRACRLSCVAVAEQTTTALPAGVSERFWHWPEHGRVRYLAADRARGGRSASSTVVFVSGFGTSASDFLGNLAPLAELGHTAIAVDLLGLGASAVDCPDVAGRVSPALWLEQLIAFLRDFDEPVYLAGNSLGGLLAASVAASHPHLVRGAVLLAPAPFWSALPDKTPEFLRSMTRAVLRLFWTRLTHIPTLENTLKLVYADPDKVPPRTIPDILAPTSAPHALTSFQAALTSAPLERSFEECIRLAFADGDTPLALIYGREDPWVVPIFGLRVKRIAPASAYYELSPCGHCPHAEAPGAVNAIIDGWVRAVDSGKHHHIHDTRGQGGRQVINGVTVRQRDAEPRNFFERFASAENYALVFMVAYASTFFATTGSAAEI